MRNLRAIALSTAEELAEKNHPTISSRENVSKLISLFQNTHFYEVIVLDGVQQSVVTVRDILRVTHPEKTPVASISFRPPRISPITRVYDVATTLFHDRIRLVPVYGDQDFIGVVTQGGILEELKDCEELRDIFAEELMVKSLETIERNSTVGLARSLMLKKGISHLPVTGGDGKLVGLVAAKDFVLHFVKPKKSMKQGHRGRERLGIGSMHLASISDRHPLQANLKTPMHVIAREMVDMKKSSCLVVDGHSKPLGIITPREIISLLMQFKPRMQIPLYMVGFDGVDDLELNSARRKIERVAVRGLKMHPDIQEIVVHGKTSSDGQGGRKRFKMNARVHTTSETFSVTAEGWSFLTVTDDLCESLDKRLRREKTFRTRRAVVKRERR